jgi:uncharacterized protein YabE (DUF348 family)
MHRPTAAEAPRTQLFKRLFSLTFLLLLLGGFSAAGRSYAQEMSSDAIVVTIVYEGYRINAKTAPSTVAAILTDLSIPHAADSAVYPDLGTYLPAGGTILVENKEHVAVVADGQTREHRTFAKTVGEALTELGLQADTDDELEPAAETVLHGVPTITLHRIDKKLEQREEPIAFNTVYENDADLLQGESRTIAEGEPGAKTLEVEVVTRDGEVIAENILNETVTRDPADKRVARGTKIPPPPPAAETAMVMGATSTGETSGGKASWFRHPGLTAAHRTYAKGTKLNVHNPDTGKSVTVTIVGYGPMAWTGREIDLSYDAFAAIEHPGRGVIPHVTLQVVP